MPTMPVLARRKLSIATISLVLAPVIARAQAADAESEFDRGDKLMAQGNIAEACDAFELSNRLDPRAGTLIRLGECREANHQLASAWTAYKQALSRVKDPHKREVAAARVAALEPQLSYLTVLVPDDSRLVGLAIARNGFVIDSELWNRPIPIDAGNYVIAARAPDRDVFVFKLEVPSEPKGFTVNIPKLAPIVKAKPTPAPPAPPVSPWTATRKVAVGSAGLGVVAIAIGGVFGLHARSMEDNAFRVCADPSVPCERAAVAQAELDRASRRALYANIGLGVGVAAIATGAVLWFRGAPKERISVSATPAGASVRVEF